MDTPNLPAETSVSKLLPQWFNKKKFTNKYSVTTNPYLQEIQNLSKNQCLSKTPWPKIEKIHGWMISAETATFMKCGGLGMIASELPEAFNCKYGPSEEIVIITPLYTGNTGKKKAELKDSTYFGAEHKNVDIKCELISPQKPIAISHGLSKLL